MWDCISLEAGQKSVINDMNKRESPVLKSDLIVMNYILETYHVGELVQTVVNDNNYEGDICIGIRPQLIFNTFII